MAESRASAAPFATWRAARHTEVMMDLRRALFLLLPLALVVACSGKAENSSAEDGDGDRTSGDGDGDGDGDGAPIALEEALEGRTLVLESADGYEVISYTMVSVSFDQEVISFAADCNRYSAEVTFEEDVLVTDSFGSTMVGCEQELHDQDDWFAAFFSDGPTAKIDGDRVTFTTDDATLVFVEEVADDVPPLVGPVWEIWALTEGNSANGGFAVAPTVTFEEDGTVHVFSGCNNGQGEYAIDASTIRFNGGIGYTEAGCPDDEMADVESHMQAIFTTGEVTYSFNLQNLAIDKGGLGMRAREQE